MLKYTILGIPKVDIENRSCFVRGNRDLRDRTSGSLGNQWRAAEHNHEISKTSVILGGVRCLFKQEIQS